MLTSYGIPPQGQAGAGGAVTSASGDILSTDTGTVCAGPGATGGDMGTLCAGPGLQGARSVCRHRSSVCGPWPAGVWLGLAVDLLG